MLTRTVEPLARWTTLRLGGPAQAFVEADSRDELYAAVAAADNDGTPVLVLGGGSNLLVADAGFAGTVVRVANRGDVMAGSQCSGGEVTVEAGQDWDGLVARAVDEEWIGVEALSGIPGTIGAVPIQNVGAYGQEVSDTIAQVHVYDRLQRRTRTIFAFDCAFGYRTSLFKREPGRYVVGAVTFQFRLGNLGAPIRYAELARALGIGLGERAPSAVVRDAVLRLRASKGMVLDDADRDTWSAGSFFTNPFVTADALPDGAPSYPQRDGTVKTSAAWLIERAGFGKGYGNERASLSTKHTLALTNRGDATTDDLVCLAREIRDGVLDRFGISLRPEPVCVGCSI
ncbi:MAG: UDP-N-acetylmuramate dehydrogenase [Propionibacteriales bacterium]|nr:UDP-N-acetylmuramate dehydrogenase [Propionibacteriales bacterium]